MSGGRQISERVVTSQKRSILDQELPRLGSLTLTNVNIRLAEMVVSTCRVQYK